MAVPDTAKREMSVKTSSDQFQAQTSGSVAISGAVYNPSDPLHFMRLKPVHARIRIWKNSVLLAETTRALRLLEVGHDIYDPVLYIPRAHAMAAFGDSRTKSHCPLKGDARYYDLLSATGELDVPDIAWYYPDPFEFAAEIGERVAFYGSKVTTEESPI